MRIPLKPRKKISSVWIFLKVEESSGLLGSLEIINIDGASPTSQPLWGQFMQKEGQYLNLGKVTQKPRGIFIQSCKGRNLSNLMKKKRIFLWSEIILFWTWYNFPLVLVYQKMTSSCVDIIDFLSTMPPRCCTYKIEICLIDSSSFSLLCFLIVALFPRPPFSLCVLIK